MFLIWLKKNLLENGMISQWTPEILGWISCSLFLRMNKVILLLKNKNPSK